MSAYCLSNGKADLKMARKLEREIRRQYPNHLTWVKDNGHLWCLPLGLDKGTALKEFTRLYGGDVVMIGHDSSDIPALRAASLSLAPANAVLDINVDYISPYPYTEGIVDCLEYVMLRRETVDS